MTTLASPAFAALMDRLFAEADATRAQMNREFAALPAEQRDAFRANMSDYKSFYGRMKDHHLAVSRETARLLYMLGRAMDACAVVEFGTSFGLSTLHLAAVVKDNGGGKVITTEFEPSKIAAARETFAASGLAEFIELRGGDALETLAKDLPARIDLVLLDGAKNLYPRILALLEPHLRSGALIVADNADMCPDYLAHIREPANGYLSVPFADDIELSQKM